MQIVTPWRFVETNDGPVPVGVPTADRNRRDNFKYTPKELMN